jgi:hypothetical protein
MMAMLMLSSDSLTSQLAAFFWFGLPAAGAAEGAADAAAAASAGCSGSGAPESAAAGASAAVLRIATAAARRGAADSGGSAARRRTPLAPLLCCAHIGRWTAVPLLDIRPWFNSILQIELRAFLRRRGGWRVAESASGRNTAVSVN